MLENIPNNSMYTIIEPQYEECETYETELDIAETYETLFDIDTSFIEESEDELEDLLKHEPS